MSVKGSRQETAILTLKVWDIDFSCLDEDVVCACACLLQNPRKPRYM